SPLLRTLYKFNTLTAPPQSYQILIVIHKSCRLEAFACSYQDKIYHTNRQWLARVELADPHSMLRLATALEQVGISWRHEPTSLPPLEKTDHDEVNEFIKELEDEDQT